jgi:alpha-L-arabinofuranosidase
VVDPAYSLGTLGHGVFGSFIDHPGRCVYESCERVVLEHSYDDVDFISCHAYYQERHGERGSFLASAVNMDAFIEAVIAMADSVKAALRSQRMINISFDEWNVWYADRYNTGGKITGIANWPYAPRCSKISIR